MREKGEQGMEEGERQFEGEMRIIEKYGDSARRKR